MQLAKSDYRRQSVEVDTLASIDSALVLIIREALDRLKEEAHEQTLTTERLTLNANVTEDKTEERRAAQRM